MPPFVGEAVFALVAIAVTWLTIQAQRRSTDAAPRAAQVAENVEATLRLTAHFAPLPPGVALVIRDYTSPRLGTRVEVSGVEPRLQVAQAAAGVHATGDHVLDERLQVQGPALLVAALLGAPTRDALKALAAISAIEPGTLTVQSGVLSADIPRFFGIAGPDPVEQVAGAALEVVKRLRPLAQPHAALAANARRDPNPAVRLRSLQVLLRATPPYAGTPDVLRAAAGDPDGEVRLEAARALGAEGLPVLERLARDTTVEDGCSARAVEALGELDLDAARAILAGTRVLTRRACIAALARAGGPEALALLTGALRAEPPVAVSAAAALGRIGTAEVLPVLHEAARSRDGEVRRAAQAAVAEIQARIGAAPGRLTLSAGDAGQVSLVRDGDGRLSIDPHQPPDDDPAGG